MTWTLTLEVPEPVRTAPEDFVVFFRNRFGEQMLFVQSPNEPTATLLHSDLGWDPATVINGVAKDVIVDPDEASWLAAAWRASDWVRGEPTVDADELGYSAGRRLAERPDLAHGLAQSPMSNAYRAAKTTLVYLAGIEAGSAGIATNANELTSAAVEFLNGVHRALR